MTDPMEDFDIGQLGDPTTTEAPVPNHRAGRTDTIVTPDGGPTRSGRFFERAAKGAKTGAQSSRTRAKSPPPDVVPGEFVEPVTHIYNLLAMVVMPFKPQAMMVMIGPARPATEDEAKANKEPPTVNEQCAIAWDKAAQKNESVRRTLKTVTTAGVWGELILVHMPIAAAFMAGTPAGDALETLLNPTAQGAENFLKEDQEK